MTTESKPVLCIGLTPALQRTLYFNELKTGDVNRATRQLLSPGGKACNAARTLNCLGREAIILGFNGGTSGRELEQQLDDLNLRHDFVEIAAPTRTCTTAIDLSSGAITELVEESPWPSDRIIEAFFQNITHHAANASAAIIAGALPPGANSDFYADIIKLLHEQDVPVFIDTNGDPCVKACAEAPLFVKMNYDEKLKTERVCKRDLEAHALEQGVKALLITNGKKSASLYEQNENATFSPPVITEVNNLGSGDATTAGTTHAWLKGNCMRDAVIYGLACGTANALTEAPGQIDVEQASKLYDMLSGA